MQWLSQDQRAVSIASTLGVDEARRCLDAGLELEHRFLLKFCEKVNRFGTSCEDTRRVVHNFSFDPIQELYRVVKDRLGDIDDPERFTYDQFSDALNDTTKILSIDLPYIGGEEAYSRFAQHLGEFNLGVRVRTTCKGNVPEFLVDLSYFFTFGLVDLYGQDTGWEYFDLTG